VDSSRFDSEPRRSLIVSAKVSSKLGSVEVDVVADSVDSDSTARYPPLSEYFVSGETRIGRRPKGV